MSRKVDIVSVKKNMRAQLMRKKPFCGGTDAGKGSCPTVRIAPRTCIVVLPPFAFPPLTNADESCRIESLHREGVDGAPQRADESTY